MIEYLVIAAAVASLFAAFAYIHSMFKGGAKPNRVSWFMWAVAPFIATAASISSGVSWAVLPVFMAGFSPFLIFTASFLTKKAHWKISTFDYSCGVLSVLALILWGLTENPNVAIVFAMASDALASIPTLTKAWAHPETESVWPFLIGAFGASAGLAAATLWIFSEYAFPAYLLIVNIIVLLAMYNKKLAQFAMSPQSTGKGPDSIF
jgi:hypothetical protein